MLWTPVELAKMNLTTMVVAGPLPDERVVICTNVGQWMEKRRRLRHPDGLTFLESELTTEEEYQELRASRRAAAQRVRQEAKEVAKRTFAYTMSVGLSYELARGAGKTASRRIVTGDATAPPPYGDVAWDKRAGALSSVPATLRDMFQCVDE